jgi:hypothetical protein
VRSGREGRGAVARGLRNGAADTDAVGTEFTIGVEFKVMTEEDIGIDRDAGRGEAGISNCMVPPTRPGGSGDKA